MRDMISEPDLFEGAVHALGNCAFAKFFDDFKLLSLQHDRYLLGIPEAASEYAGAIGYHFSLPILKRRVKEKTYGEPRPIEGRYHTGDDVVLIDDVISSAKSKVEEAKLLSLHGLNTAGVAVLVDRQQGGRTELADRGIDFVAALTISSIAKFAVERETISQSMYEQVISELDPNEI
jgi:orotate phosphoribosyltransferase